LIQQRTRLFITDKTSALQGICIKVLKGKFLAKMGDTFLLSIRSRSAKRAKLLKMRLQKKFSVGSLHRALLVRSKFNFKRFPGLFVKFFDNSCALVNRRVVPISNRIYGPVLKEFCMKWPSVGCVVYVLFKDFLRQLDFFFFFKNILRFLLINKYGLFLNVNSFPLIKKLIVFFSIFNIIDFDDVRAFNYSYFIGFFFGRFSFFSKASFIFHLNVTYFSYRVFCLFFSQDVFFPLAFFINDVLVLSYRDFIISKFFLGKGIFSILDFMI
jgi:large subunit ribosomal protein L14